MITKDIKQGRLFLTENENTELSLGDRIKQYEDKCEYIIPTEEHIIVRIDGHHFSSFTKGFDKPFDELLSNSMIATTQDLLERFGAYSAYTQSDEITLFIPSLKDDRIRYTWTHMFGGRTHKIASLFASYTTKQFNKHLTNEIKNFAIKTEDLNKLAELNKKIGNADFDARVFGVSSNEEVFNIFMWRSRDCIKNSKSMFSQAACSHGELQNKNGEEQIEYTLKKCNKDFHLLEDRYKYGVLIKKELYEKDIVPNEYNSNKAKLSTVRSRTTKLCMPMNSFSSELVQIVSSQYINDIT